MNGAIATNEANVAMYSKLGAIYKNANNFPKAIQMYEKGSQLDPRTAHCFRLLPSARQRTAMRKRRSSATSRPWLSIRNPPRIIRRSAIFTCNSRKQRRRSAPTRNIYEKNQDNAIARFVGEQAIAQKNYPEAVKYLGMVGGPDAQSPQFLLIYGNTCYQARQDSTALQIYKKLAGIMPQNAEVFNALYELTLRTGTKDEALLYLKKYAELKPQDAVAQRTLGDLLYERKDRAGALAAYHALVKADSTAKGYYGHYADL